MDISLRKPLLVIYTKNIPPEHQSFRYKVDFLQKNNLKFHRSNQILCKFNLNLFIFILILILLFRFIIIYT